VKKERRGRRREKEKRAEYTFIKKEIVRTLNNLSGNKFKI